MPWFSGRLNYLVRHGFILPSRFSSTQFSSMQYDSILQQFFYISHFMAQKDTHSHCTWLEYRTDTFKTHRTGPKAARRPHYVLLFWYLQYGAFGLWINTVAWGPAVIIWVLLEEKEGRWLPWVQSCSHIWLQGRIESVIIPGSLSWARI